MKKVYNSVRLVMKSFEEINLNDYCAIIQDNSKTVIDFDKTYCDFKKVMTSNNYYAICLKSTTLAIGLLYVKETKKGYVEVGYLMNANYQDCGYASEALYEVCNELEQNGEKYIIGNIKEKSVKPFKLLGNINFIGIHDFHKVVAYCKD